ncbi:MAG: alpha/beta fold hydrolase [Alphaproteobacteria bacterium]
MKLVFVHGWGMDARIWDSIVTEFKGHEIHRADLGFIGGTQTKGISGKSIYITHSLGTMWSLQNHCSDMLGLICVNGFTCFQSFSSERTLRTMQRRLGRNPSAQMKSFWQGCGLSEDMQNNLDQDLNIDRLHVGLDWLVDWDMSEKLHDLPVPVMSLGGRDDLVLPQAQMNDHWSGFDLQINAKAGHVLPLSHPEWCVDRIKDFMREHDLEK